MHLFRVSVSLGAQAEEGRQEFGSRPALDIPVFITSKLQNTSTALQKRNNLDASAAGAHKHYHLLLESVIISFPQSLYVDIKTFLTSNISSFKQQNFVRVLQRVES